MANVSNLPADDSGQMGGFPVTATQPPSDRALFEGACMWETTKRDTVGLACSNCGHNNNLHPGVANPGLVVCLACEIQNAKEEG